MRGGGGSSCPMLLNGGTFGGRRLLGPSPLQLRERFAAIVYSAIVE